MNLLIIKLLVAILCLTVLVQSANTDVSKLTPEQRKKLAGAIFGSVGSKGKSVPRCTQASCGNGYVCTGGTWGCAVKKGNKCQPTKDKCEGRYYCPASGFCNGQGRGKLNDPCEGTLGCNNGLYCDLNQKKCLKVEGKSMCTRPSECYVQCPDKSCTCVGGECVRR